jgi:hypothetical protein
VLSDLATAHGWSAGAGPFSVLPLVGSVISLTLLRVALRVTIGPGAIAASLVLGTVFWFLADAWGITLAVSGFVLVATIAAVVVRRGRSAST